MLIDLMTGESSNGIRAYASLLDLAESRIHLALWLWNIESWQ